MINYISKSKKEEMLNNMNSYKGVLYFKRTNSRVNLVSRAELKYVQIGGNYEESKKDFKRAYKQLIEKGKYQFKDIYIDFLATHDMCEQLLAEISLNKLENIGFNIYIVYLEDFDTGVLDLCDLEYIERK